MSGNSLPPDAPQVELESDRLLAPRRQKLDELRRAGNAFPNDFRVDATAAELQARYAGLDAGSLEQQTEEHALAGRMMSQRLMGKLAFAHLQDRSGKIQILVRPEQVGEQVYEDFKRFDLGDIVGVRGRAIRTKAGELSLFVTEVRLLSKSLRPLPEKWHGLTDREARYRQRYVDLIINADSRKVFLDRSRILSGLRRFLDERGFVEVETPVLHAQYGGASARPFTTHHNALDAELFLRIAPELSLKRLVVGGIERVFEIGKNFRNEGLSIQHSPEFTMLEFYWAYANYQDLMALTEQLFAGLAQQICGTTRLQYQGKEIDLAPPWRRISVADAAVELGGVPRSELGDRAALARRATALGITVTDHMGPGKLLMELIDALVESQLVQPTFLTDFPLEVSPLSRRKDSDPELVDRFELYVCGREMANGFSELNDPDDQRSRFEAQVRARQAGDDEAPGMDEDYVRALEYGMPPTAGEGIGIDRLVMLLTDQPSIRDVLLFPLLRSRDDA